MRLLLLVIIVVVVLLAACCFRLIFFHVFIFVLCLRAHRLPLSLPALSRFPFNKFDCYKFVPDKISHVFFCLGSKPPSAAFGTDFILAFSSYINCL